MGVFLNRLRTEREDIDSDVETLVSPLLFSSDILNKLIEVPTGFKTDNASVPRIPFAYLLVGGTADAAAAVHDYLYTVPPELPGLTKFQADMVFLEAMIASGIPYWRRQLMYFAVRWFGRGAWDERSG